MFLNTVQQCNDLTQSHFGGRGRALTHISSLSEGKIDHFPSCLDSLSARALCRLLDGFVPWMTIMLAPLVCKTIQYLPQAQHIHSEQLRKVRKRESGRGKDGIGLFRWMTTTDVDVGLIESLKRPDLALYHSLTHQHTHPHIPTAVFSGAKFNSKKATADGHWPRSPSINYRPFNFLWLRVRGSYSNTTHAVKQNLPQPPHHPSKAIHGVRKNDLKLYGQVGMITIGTTSQIYSIQYGTMNITFDGELNNVFFLYSEKKLR